MSSFCSTDILFYIQVDDHEHDESPYKAHVQS